MRTGVSLLQKICLHPAFERIPTLSIFPTLSFKGAFSTTHTRIATGVGLLIPNARVDIMLRKDLSGHCYPLLSRMVWSVR